MLTFAPPLATEEHPPEIKIRISPNIKRLKGIMGITGTAFSLPGDHRQQ
ncbi:hypothetical protein [Paenibacillus albidus]|nr:hypothetical protein [Paenibacillus albidus]